LTIAISNARNYQYLIQTQELLKEERDRIQKSEKKYRLLTENMKDVVWVLDIESRKFLYVSPSVQHLRGYSSEEVMAVPMDDALTPQAKEQVNKLMQQEIHDFLANKGNASRFHITEVDQPCKDGSTVWTEVITQYRKNDESGRVEVVGVTRDISERKQAAQEREKLIANLQKALAEIKSLRGILPICSVCKKIRDDKGAWNQMEIYIREHTDAEFSHGYCPECGKRALDAAHEFSKKNKR
jgi:PAS domain S-box-containing protein